MRTDIGSLRLARFIGFPFHVAILSILALTASVFSSPLLAQGITTRVSVASGGVQANGAIFAAISENGRFVAFQSDASDLVVGDTNHARDVFVHDLVTGTTTRVSVGPGGLQSNGTSEAPVLSADGRFVAFQATATNLVPGDTNVWDVFVHDRNTGTTTLVSIGPAGVRGNGYSQSPAISADGRFVAFHSNASNLVSDDTNGYWDVFVHDRQTQTTTRVSVADHGLESEGGSNYPAISADGRFVAFTSLATDLVPGDTNGHADVFVHDRSAGTTTRVSVRSDGGQVGMGGDDPDISGDGRLVVFQSLAGDLVDDDTLGVQDIFVHDCIAGTTTRISTGPGVEANTHSYFPAISADGRFVAYQSMATNLISGDTNNSYDVFIYDRERGTTIRASVSSEGVQGNGHSVAAALSGHGQAVAFHSDASTLVTGDTNAVFDVFVNEPAGFRKSAPANGASDQPSTLTITWQPSTGATSYEYCYDTSDNLLCDGTWAATSETSATITGLDGSRTYYWQVRNGATYADSGRWWSFATSIMPPRAFAKSSPPDATTLHALPVTLTWTASSGAASYEYCYDTVNNDVCDASWISAGSSTNVTIGGLAATGNYYWQVRAQNTGGTTYANSGSWWSLTMSLSPPNTAPPRTALPAGDYDGDGKDDIAVYRPSTGMWYVIRSSTGTGWQTQWGWPTDTPVPADYDGDGRTDIAVYRPSTGMWYVIRSSTGTGWQTQWGWPTDTPVPADYDGDGRRDVAVYRPSTGVWYVIRSSTNSIATYQWGAAEDLPVPGDYDGDGRADPTVFRPSTGVWYEWRTTTDTGFEGVWGIAGDVPLNGDYDGDGKADPTIFRASSGMWYLWRSTTGTGFAIQWGMWEDLPK